MFVREAKKRVVKWPVSVSIPQDGGTVKTYKFTAHLEVLSKDEHEKAAQEGDLLERVLLGWEDDYVDEAKKPIEFTPENKAEMLQQNNIRVGLFGAITEVQSGVAAKRKN